MSISGRESTNAESGQPIAQAPIPAATSARVQAWIDNTGADAPNDTSGATARPSGDMVPVRIAVRGGGYTIQYIPATYPDLSHLPRFVNPVARPLEERDNDWAVAGAPGAARVIEPAVRASGSNLGETNDQEYDGDDEMEAPSPPAPAAPTAEAAPTMPVWRDFLAERTADELRATGIYRIPDHHLVRMAQEYAEYSRLDAARGYVQHLGRWPDLEDFLEWWDDELRAGEPVSWVELLRTEYENRTDHKAGHPGYIPL